MQSFITFIENTPDGELSTILRNCLHKWSQSYFFNKKMGEAFLDYSSYSKLCDVKFTHLGILSIMGRQSSKDYN